MVQRFEHVREHFVIQRYILQKLASKDGQYIITRRSRQELWTVVILVRVYTLILR